MWLEGRTNEDCPLLGLSWSRSTASDVLERKKDGFHPSIPLLSSYPWEKEKKFCAAAIKPQGHISGRQSMRANKASPEL